MRVTINGIAKKAGVSRSTVSRVLNNDPNVSPATRKKVQDIIKEINYQPSALARGMITGSLPIVLVIVGDILNQYFANIVRGIEQVLEDAGYMAVVYNSDYNVEKEKKFIQMAQSSNFAGIIPLVAIKTEELEECIANSRCPVVLVNRQLKKVDRDSILADDTRSGYLATRHLIENGHTKIAHIAGPSHSSISRARQAGYVTALKEAGLSVQNELILEGRLDKSSGYQATQELLAHRSITAISVNNFLMCLGVIQGAREKGLYVPEDLSLVCCESIQDAYCEIGITSAGADSLSIGREAASTLLKRIQKSERPFQTVQFSPTFVDRGSVKNILSPPQVK